jgi:hypothetical protein
MVLARDLVTRDGVMLLAADFVLDESLIRQLRELEATEGHRLSIAIRPAQRGVTLVRSASSPGIMSNT